MVDTTVVDFHRVPTGGLVVSRIDGSASRVLDNGRRSEGLAVGAVLSVGDTIFIAQGGKVVASDVAMVGGMNGRAHSFVAADAFRSKPGRSDVPAIVQQLEHLSSGSGDDPFAGHHGPTTPYEHAAAAEFARLNLDLRVALELSEESARLLRAVPLFLAEETAFVAMETVDAAKAVRLMTELGRPVNPHLVGPVVLDELLDQVFG